MSPRRTRPRLIGLILLGVIALLATPLSAFASARPANGSSPAALTAAGDTVLFTDNFERTTLGSGDGWTVTTGGSGTAAIGVGLGHNGTNGAVLTEPDYLTGSIAYMRHALASPLNAVYENGWFDEVYGGCDPNAGYSQGDVPFIRFFDTNGRRVAGLYRINGSCSSTAKLYVEYGDNFYRVNKNIGLNDWNQMQLRITTGNPGNDLVQVYLNGNLNFNITNANNGLLPIASVTTHNEHAKQKGKLIADDIEVGTFGAPPPPPNGCDPAGPTPTTSDPGTTVLADGFDTNDFSKWTRTNLGADGSALVQTTTVHTPLCAAKLHVTSTVQSKANLQKDLATSVVYADGWFNVTAEGASNSIVPEFRLFIGATRLVSIYRVNIGGNMYLSVGGAFISLGQARPLNTWFHLNVHAIANGAASTIVVTLDGVQRYSNTAVNLGTATSFTTLLVGSEIVSQVGDLNVDDVVIKTVP
jgi:hypothetical protein